MFSYISHPDNTQMYKIKGLSYYSNYIDECQSKDLLQIIENNTWLQEILRRQQHYGPIYYHTRHNLQDKIFEADNPPNQCLVNEYIGDQSLALHLEDQNAFGQIIAGLTLLNPCYLSLRNITDKSQKIKIFLEKNSLYVLKFDARNEWQHGIEKMKIFYDPNNGETFFKGGKYRRLSLTFRHVLLEGTKKVVEGEKQFKQKNDKKLSYNDYLQNKELQ